MNKLSVTVDGFTERNLDKILCFLYGKTDIELIINIKDEDKLINEILMMNTINLDINKEFISIYGTKVKWLIDNDIKENTFNIKYK